MFLLEMALHFVTRFERQKTRRTSDSFGENVGVQADVVLRDVGHGVTHGADVVVRHLLTRVARTPEPEHPVRSRRLFPFRPPVIVFVHGHDESSIFHAEFPLLFQAGRRSFRGFRLRMDVAVVIVVDADFGWLRV